MSDEGTIYILKNKSMPNQYKIGRTTQILKNRIAGYSSMGLDHKFVPIFDAKNKFHTRLEKFIHGELIKCRVHPKREYFNFTDDCSAIAAVVSAIDKFNASVGDLQDPFDVIAATPIIKPERGAGAPTSLRLPDSLLRQLTKAAHKCEMSRTQYITAALQAAVRHDLPTPEYKAAWSILSDIFDALSPDVDANGYPNTDMRLASALETILPRLRGVE
jgi:hypothetical protein